MPPRARSPASATPEIVSGLESLRQELQLLRQVLDEVREEFSWAVRNRDAGSLPLPFPLSSMPAEPTLSAGLQVPNRFTAAVRPTAGPTDQHAARVTVDRRQFEQAVGRLTENGEPPAVGDAIQVEASRLAAALESVEQLTYCCDRPDLQWHGDPDSPGISCAHCGFPVAEEGSLLCWRDAPPSVSDQPSPAAHAAAAPPPTVGPTQGKLF